MRLLGVGCAELTRIVRRAFAIACLLEKISKGALPARRTRSTRIILRGARLKLTGTRIHRGTARQSVVVLACLAAALFGARHTGVLSATALNAVRIPGGVVVKGLRALAGGGACFAGVVHRAFALRAVALFAVRAPEIGAWARTGCAS